MTFIYGNEKLSGINSIGQHLFLSQLENNLKSFLEWGLLNIGGFINVTRSQSNIHGSQLFKLKPTADPNYKTSQVWQTMRKDWVWEDNIQYSGISSGNGYVSPILISGIYINDMFYPVGTADPNYSYKIDYINSRIVFDNQICNSSDIQMEYAYRWAQVYTYDNAKWWQQLQYRTDENTLHFNQIRQGDFSVFSTNRIQLPSIIIESIPRGTSKPYRLGDKSLVMDQDIMCHIISENRHDRNMLIDILRLQQDKVIWLYDTNEVIKNNVYPYNIDGTLNSGRLTYKELLDSEDYRLNKCILKDIYASDVESFSPFLSESSVRLTLEVIFEILN